MSQVPPGLRQIVWRLKMRLNDLVRSSLIPVHPIIFCLNSLTNSVFKKNSFSKKKTAKKKSSKSTWAKKFTSLVLYSSKRPKSPAAYHVRPTCSSTGKVFSIALAFSSRTWRRRLHRSSEKQNRIFSHGNLKGPLGGIIPGRVDTRLRW